MSFLLDSSVCISYLRGRETRVLDRFRSHRPDELSVCSTVRSELVFGALRSRDPAKSLEAVRRFLEPLTSHPLTDEVADLAAELRSELASRGMTIGPYDLLIAATAKLHNLVLVSHNLREFSLVKGLSVEDWKF